MWQIYKIMIDFLQIDLIYLLIVIGMTNLKPIRVPI